MWGDIIGIVGVVVDELIIRNFSLVAVHSGGCVVVTTTIEILVIVVVIIGVKHVELVVWLHFVGFRIKTLIGNQS